VTCGAPSELDLSSSCRADQGELSGVAPPSPGKQAKVLSFLYGRKSAVEIGKKWAKKGTGLHDACRGGPGGVQG